MGNETAFTRVDPELLPMLQMLTEREPIFHTREFGRTVEDFERATAPSYWEVGASGRRYSREFILKTLGGIERVDAEAAGWRCSDFGLRQLGSDCFLLTYTLNQNGRITRRATIWERADEAWRILYHQGTIVSSDADDAIPPALEKGQA